MSRLDELLVAYPPAARTELERLLLERVKELEIWVGRIMPYAEHRDGCKNDPCTCGMNVAVGAGSSQSGRER